MEIRKPRFPLDDVKRLIRSGQCKLLESAKKTAQSIGFSESEAKDVVASLERKDFFKSATDFHNSSSWQDYYSKKVNDIDIFIKLKISKVEDDFVLILSFKRDENAGGAL